MGLFFQKVMCIYIYHQYIGITSSIYTLSIYMSVYTSSIFGWVRLFKLNGCSTGFDILPLQVSTDIQTSIDQFLSPEVLSSQNKWFCPSCKTLSGSSRETCVMNSAPILAIQLCHFSNQGGQLVKDETLSHLYPKPTSSIPHSSHNY